MTRAAPTSDKPRPIPGRIGAVLKVVAALIAHARHFAATVRDRVDVPEFAAVAAILGTYDVPVILNRVQRGILRALALQDYLLARAARGRNLRFAWPPRVELQPHHRPPPRPAPAARAVRTSKAQPDPALLGPDDPGAYSMPTQAELAAWVRRRPVGRTMTYICLDLGIVPCLCDGIFWNRVEKVLRRYGGSLSRLYQVRAVREKTFQQERDRRPETWHVDWREMPRPTVRALLGCLIGEPVPGLPAIVPS
jgi:hypothetical protein